MAEDKHILVLEDDLPTLTMVRKMLSSAGYRVTAVGDGASAIEAARRDPPDLVVCDLAMPGVDGYQVIMELRSDSAFRAPIVVVSGRTGEEDRRAATVLGADAFLEKPVARQKLLDTVADQLSPTPKHPLPDDPRRHIMVFDDEPSTLHMLGSMLETAGYRVSTVETGDAAFQVVRLDPPDLVVTDLAVPGIGGVQLIMTLRKKMGFTAPIIAISGHSGEEGRRSALNAGATLFLSKPVERKTFLGRVSGLLQGESS